MQSLVDSKIMNLNEGSVETISDRHCAATRVMYSCAMLLGNEGFSKSSNMISGIHGSILNNNIKFTELLKKENQRDLINGIKILIPVQSTMLMDIREAEAYNLVVKPRTMELVDITKMFHSEMGIKSIERTLGSIRRKMEKGD